MPTRRRIAELLFRLAHKIDRTALDRCKICDGALNRFCEDCYREALAIINDMETK